MKNSILPGPTSEAAADQEAQKRSGLDPFSAKDSTPRANENQGHRAKISIADNPFRFKVPLFQSTRQRALRRRYRQAERELLLAAGDEDRYENARNALETLRQEVFIADPSCSWIPQNLGPEAVVNDWLRAMRSAVDEEPAAIVQLPHSDLEAA